MKRIVAVTLAVIMTLCFASCGEKKSAATLEDKYIAAVQKCIDSGENDKAVELLKQGIEKTKSEKLQQMLDSLGASNTTDVPTTEAPTTAATTAVEISTTQIITEVKTEVSQKSYVGTWVNDAEKVWIRVTDESATSMVFDMTTESKSGGKVAAAKNIYAEKSGSSAKGHFSEDGWGNSGDITLTLMDNSIVINSVEIDGAIESWSLGANDNEVLKKTDSPYPRFWE